MAAAMRVTTAIVSNCRLVVSLDIFASSHFCSPANRTCCMGGPLCLRPRSTVTTTAPMATTAMETAATVETAATAEAAPKSAAPETTMAETTVAGSPMADTASAESSAIKPAAVKSIKTVAVKPIVVKVIIIETIAVKIVITGPITIVARVIIGTIIVRRGATEQSNSGRRDHDDEEFSHSSDHIVLRR